MSDRSDSRRTLAAARVYLALIHSTLNKQIITDAEFTFPEERREETRYEVVKAL